MNIIDSSGWLEYFANTKYSEQYKKAVENIDQLLVPTVSLFEVYRVVLRQREKKDADTAIALMRMGFVVELTEEIALHAAALSYEKKLPFADSIIYATTLKYKATLWTQDVDFKGLERVKYFPKK